MCLVQERQAVLVLRPFRFEAHCLVSGGLLDTPGAIASPVDAALETELCKEIEARDEGLGRLDLLSSFKDRLTRK